MGFTGELLVKRLQAQDGFVGPVNSPLVSCYSYSCSACMPQVTHEQEEAQTEVGRLIANYGAKQS
jgi:hypothetical protein